MAARAGGAAPGAGSAATGGGSALICTAPADFGRTPAATTAIADSIVTETTRSEAHPRILSRERGSPTYVAADWRQRSQAILAAKQPSEPRRRPPRVRDVDSVAAD